MLMLKIKIKNSGTLVGDGLSVRTRRILAGHADETAFQFERGARWVTTLIRPW